MAGEIAHQDQGNWTIDPRIKASNAYRTPIPSKVSSGHPVFKRSYATNDNRMPFEIRPHDDKSMHNMVAFSSSSDEKDIGPMNQEGALNGCNCTRSTRENLRRGYPLYTVAIYWMPYLWLPYARQVKKFQRPKREAKHMKREIDDLSRVS